MTDINTTNISAKKYNSFESLITNMYFIAFYALSVIYTINYHTFFIEKLWVKILFIISIFFCSIVLLHNLILFYINRQIDITEAVMLNIKKINIIYICIYIVRFLFLLLFIPIQLFLFCEFFKCFLNVAIPLYVVISFVLLSIILGVRYLLKRRQFILNFIREVREL